MWASVGRKKGAVRSGMEARLCQRDGAAVHFLGYSAFAQVKNKNLAVGREPTRCGGEKEEKAAGVVLLSWDGDSRRNGTRSPPPLRVLPTGKRESQQGNRLWGIKDVAGRWSVHAGHHCSSKSSKLLVAEEKMGADLCSRHCNIQYLRT